MSIRARDFSAIYVLTDVELSKLLKVLLEENRVHAGYEASMYLLLKELNFDVQRLVRLLMADSTTKKKVFAPSMLWRFTTVVKEVIVIVAFENAKANQEYISIVGLSRTPRYTALGIDRNFIHRTLKRYNIKYNKRDYKTKKSN